MIAARIEYQEALRIRRTVLRLWESEPGLCGVKRVLRLVEGRSVAYIVMAPGHIRLSISPARTRLLGSEQLLAVIAHEVGHYLIAQGGVPAGMTRHEEEFAADAHAARIAGPAAVIAMLRAVAGGRVEDDAHPSTDDRIARLELVAA